MLLVLILRSRLNCWLVGQMIGRPWTRLLLLAPLVLLVGGQALGLYLRWKLSKP